MSVNTEVAKLQML